MFIASPFRLHKSGIVGMNQRNVVLIAQNNPRRLYPLADNKLKTKELLEKAGIATPRLLGTIHSQAHIRELESFLSHHNSFVMKPAKGSGGKGILVIKERTGKQFIKSSGSIITSADIKRHASNTLGGLFSLGGNNDVVMIEEMVNFSDHFDGYSYQGIPDIRIIVYKGFPILAMTRLSTKVSDGKANLHQGAVGVGIDITSGDALRAIQYGRPVLNHPDTGKDLSDFSVPEWNRFTALASGCYEITGLGYLGVDIVLDALKGPQILELNARPGLAIQVASKVGLQSRINRIEKLLETDAGPQFETAPERCAFTASEF